MNKKLKYSYWQCSSKKNTKTGFTLVELLIVIVITGIMPAMIMPSLWHHYYLRQEQTNIYHRD